MSGHPTTPTGPDARNAAQVCDPASRTWDNQDRLVTECVMALSEFSTEELHELAEHAERVVGNPDGWLPKMIREYVGVWR